jgi:hypothetical protein
LSRPTSGWPLALIGNGTAKKSHEDELDPRRFR